MSTAVKIDLKTGDAPALDTAAFRKVLGTFATGVTIITAKAADGALAGVTANSFNSVSMDPPLVLWSLARKSSSFNAFTTASHWAVHILSHEQHDLSGRFARPVPADEKFAGVAYDAGEGGVPLLSGCSSRIQCRSAHIYEGGDHIILVGEVIKFERCDVPPLVYQDGGYAIATSLRQELPPAGEDPRNVSASSSLGYLLASASLHYNARFYQGAAQFNLNETEQLVLSALAAREPRTYDELITLVNYSGRAIGNEVINDLAARTLIRIADEPGTGGSEDDAQIALTEQGWALANKIRDEADRLEDLITQQLGAADTTALRHLLSRFVRVYSPLMRYRWF